MGALAVCADGLLSVSRSAVPPAMTALEGLAAKLGRSLENVALADRLMKAEKLAGLGLLAGGVAHALNNPLTAVLGFADLIAHTSAEARVQTDAKRIVQEARRMRDMVESLVNYWQPDTMVDEQIEVPALLQELAERALPGWRKGAFVWWYRLRKICPWCAETGSGCGRSSSTC